MGVVEAPIEHPNEHAFSMEGLGQSKPCMHAVHTRAVPCFVDVGNRTGSQFDGRHGELRQGIQVEGVHSERSNARPASAGIDMGMGIGPRLPSRLGSLAVEPPNEPDGGPASNHGDRMPLGEVCQRFGLGVDFGQRQKLIQGELIRGRQLRLGAQRTPSEQGDKQQT